MQKFSLTEITKQTHISSVNRLGYCKHGSNTRPNSTHTDFIRKRDSNLKQNPIIQEAEKQVALASFPEYDFV